MILDPDGACQEGSSLNESGQVRPVRPNQRSTPPPWMNLAFRAKFDGGNMIVSQRRGSSIAAFRQSELTWHTNIGAFCRESRSECRSGRQRADISPMISGGRLDVNMGACLEGSKG